MENLNAEQIKKALEHCKHQMTDSGSCKPCPYFSKAGGCMTELIGDALTLIKCQEDQIFALENRLKECENGYKGTNFLDRCKLHDAEEKVKKLTEENERLRGKRKFCYNCGKYYISAWSKCPYCLKKPDIATDVKSDTVRKMQERLDKRFCHDPAFLGVEQRLIMGVIDQIAKEMLN